MSILIKGMEMPKNCGECPFLEATSSSQDGRDYKCTRTGLYTTPRIKFIRCPLIEVPKHGRLIDERWLKDAMATTLEALIKNPKMDAQEMHIIAAFDTLREMIDDAPTFIEAESE